MHLGAYYYLNKNNLNSEFLASTILSAIKDTKQRIKLQSIQQQHQEISALNAMVLSNSLDPIMLVSDQGDIINFNPATNLLFGYQTNENLKGLPIQQLLPEISFDQAFPPLNHYTKSTGLSKQKRTLTIEFALLPLPLAHTASNNYACIVHDISAQEKLKEKEWIIQKNLEQQYQNLCNIFDLLNVSVFILNTSGEIIFKNTNMEVLTNKNLQTHSHWSKQLNLKPDSKHNFEAQLHQTEHSNKQFELEWNTPQGQSLFFNCEIKQSPQEPDQKIVFLYNITEIKTLKNKLNTQSQYEIIGDSSYTQHLKQQINSIAQGDWITLITGESGVGKELVARQLHLNSARKDKPFLGVNCAGLSAELLSSQLFGHRKGAFTGADRNHKGFFEACQHGTLFLDEIGDMPLALQAVLLRVIQEQEIIRVGDSVAKKIDTRLIFATNHDLQQSVKDGQFRADLFYRIQVAQIHIRPLREHIDDISTLTTKFLWDTKTQNQHQITGVTNSALHALQNYHWPGNIRQLRNIIQRSSIHCTSNKIDLSDLPIELQPSKPVPLVSESFNSKEHQKQELIAALKKYPSNKQKTATELGIGRATLYRWMDKFNIT